MKRKKSLLLFIAMFALAFGFVTISSPLCMGSQEQVLHSFSGPDGYWPDSSVTFDAAGNLYGTTLGGGANNYGVVFQLTPNGDGTWTETVLYNFCSLTGCADGGSPQAIAMDTTGNLYGTVSDGAGYGHGAVFEFSPGPGGTWSETVLYSFCQKSGCPDGVSANSRVIFDAAGNLYGTTVAGGKYGNSNGIVFELMPGKKGKWKEKVLHSFNPKDKAGGNPLAVTLDAAGNLYGTTAAGGKYNGGTVFELQRTNGAWKEKVLHSFGSGKDGSEPQAGVILDAAGNLYGTTSYGGTSNYGTVYQLSPGPNGTWTETILNSFSGFYGDGQGPFESLTFDGAGNLYGTTSGDQYGTGTVFELTPIGGGTWTETVLYSFSGGADGGYPYGTGPLIFDAIGNLYGTTAGGGSYVYGTVFEVTP